MPASPQRGTGLALAVTSGATFGTSGSFASALIKVGWSPEAAVLTRVTIAAILLTVPALLQLRGRRISRRTARSVLGYGVVAVAGAQLCYFNAVSHLSVAVALLLEYSGTLLVIGWGWARHGHRPRRLTLLGSAAAIAGLVFVLNLAGAHHVDVVGIWWGLGAAVGLAVYFVMAADEENTLPPLSIAWAGLVVAAAVIGAVGAVGLFPMHATRADVILFHRSVSWVVPIVGLAVVAGVVAFVTGIAAARRLGARLASFAGLTEVLFAVVFAWAVLDQRLGLMQLVGGVLVVAGIALVRRDETAAPAMTASLDYPAESALLAAEI